MRILIAVTHLLGAGHLTRAAALAHAFAAAGHESVLVSGGRPAPLVRLDGVRLVQLPPVRIEGFDFSRPIGPDGEPAGTEILAARRALLLQTLTALHPDAVITELFPFGRRGLAWEFLALVEAARALPGRPLILASVRDILVPPDRPAKVAEAHARVAALYDAVLVHGDPALVPLDASWPVDSGIAAKLHYTGYVDEGGPRPAPLLRSGILVAAGSSAAGQDLFRAAAGAARKRPELGWRLLVGHGIPDETLAALSADLPPGTVMRARADYRDLMAGVSVSISQCGYNTAVDLLATGTPSVLVPFEAGRESEQRLRAERLAALGLARIVPEDGLSPEALLAAVEELSPTSSRPSDESSGGPPHRRSGSPSGALGGGKPEIARRDGEGVNPLPSDHTVAHGHGFRLDGGPRTVAIVEAMRVKAGDRFAGLRTALDRAAAAGRTVRLWWRDDDAVAATPALDRLLTLAGGRPILVAAIPAKVEPSLGRRLASVPGVSLAIHGLAHANHAPPGEKPAEFGPHRPLDVLRDEARTALDLGRDKLPGGRVLPVFVPPWNRIAPDLAVALPALGYRGLSTAGGPPIAGLARADAGLDVIDWRGSRSLREPDAVVSAIADHADGSPTGPLGLLTHHLVHDEAVWNFLASLLPVLDHPAVEWCDPRDLFGPAVDAQAGAPISPRAERPRAG